MESVLGIVSSVWTQIGELVTFVLANPILLIPIAMGFAGSIIGLAKSLMGIRRRGRRG